MLTTIEQRLGRFLIGKKPKTWRYRTYLGRFYQSSELPAQ
ncbi:hypothetical protein PSEUDO9AZ_20751 [Pseudomonas sp. 9AZ]|nr:hypothetical protein PSEUDO9AZ_20751 [Pseudomonas sp. 9AZ]